MNKKEREKFVKDFVKQYQEAIINEFEFKIEEEHFIFRKIFQKKDFAIWISKKEE